MHAFYQSVFCGRRKSWRVFLCSAVLIVLPTSPSFAAPSMLLGQLSLPSSTPLDQNLTQLFNQLQSFMALGQQQINELLGGVQQDLSIAVQQAFGPLTLDVQEAEQKILQSISLGHTPSNSGVNSVLEHRTTAAKALTKYHQVSVLSHEAQAAQRRTLENTQATVVQINQCGEMGQSAHSTQDALKAMLCQQSGMASMDAALIPLLQKTIETNVGIETHLSLLNDQMHGQFLADTQTQMAEAAQSRLVRSSFTSLLVSPHNSPVMKARL